MIHTHCTGCGKKLDKPIEIDGHIQQLVELPYYCAYCSRGFV